MTITASQFLIEVRELGFECWGPRDKNIYCPSRDWLEDFAEYLLENRISGAAESWDCDDYALEAVAQASIACFNASIQAGHSFVYCTVRLWSALNGIEPEVDQITGHALNLVRLDSGDYFLFEPQNGSMTNAKQAIAECVVAPGCALL